MPLIFLSANFHHTRSAPSTCCFKRSLLSTASYHDIGIALFPSIRRYDLHDYTIGQTCGTLSCQMYPACPHAYLVRTIGLDETDTPVFINMENHIFILRYRKSHFLSRDKLHCFNQIRPVIDLSPDRSS